MWKPTILVVEDELGPRESFRQILKGDYRVVTKENGKSAIEYITTDKSPEAMLLDIRMPDMNGIEVLKKVKEMNPDIEVIMITAFASLATAKEAMKYGASEYLVKPSNVKEIRESIKKAVSRRIQMMQYSEKFSTLLEISESIASSQEVEDICQKVLNWCERFFLGQIVWIVLYNPKTEEIESMASKGMNGDRIFRSGIERINEKVFEQKRSILIENIQKDGLFEGNETFPKINAKSIFALPLEVRNRVIGVLGLCSPLFDDGEIDPTTMNLLTIFANQVSVALDNNLSRQQLQKNFEKLKETQQKLIQAEKFRALGEMTSGVAHNFNNFLTGIIGYASLLLQSDFTDQDSFISRIKQIEELAGEASNLVKRLQNSTKDKTESEFKVVDLRKIVEETMDLTSLRWRKRPKDKAIELKTELKETYPIVGDKGKLKEVLTNLIFNAVDAMPEGGELELKTFNEDKDVFIIVSDTGIGMTEEVKRKAFEPFFTTKEEGTGLGLSTASEIIQEHNGEISLESEPGKGTTFKIRLPKRKMEAKE